MVLRREGRIDGNDDGDLDPGETFEQGDPDNPDAPPGNYLLVHANGQQHATLAYGGTIRYAGGYSYQTEQLQSLNAGGHYAAGGGSVIVQSGETLQSLAQRVYGTSQLWYVLAEANGIQDPNEPLTAGVRLDAPSVSVNNNDASTFQPYNPNEAIGSTTPSLPYISPPQCNPVATILIVVVAIIVTVYTAGAAAQAMGAASSVTTSTAATAATGATGATGATAATAATAASGTSILGATTTGVVGSTKAMAIGSAILSGGSVAGSIGATGIATAAFAGGVAGSFAGQVAGNALGVRDGYNLREMFAGGLTTLASAGIAGALGGNATKAFDLLGKPGKAAASSVFNGITSHAAHKVVGMDVSFSWRRIAANAVTAGLTSAVVPKLTSTFGIDSEFGQDLTANLFGGASGLHVARGLGLDDDVNYGKIAADAFGNALGNAAVRAGARREMMTREEVMQGWAAEDELRRQQMIAAEAAELGLTDEIVLASATSNDAIDGTRTYPVRPDPVITVEYLPEESVVPRLSATELRAQSIEQARRSAAAHWSDNVFMRMPANAGYSMVQGANSLYGMATDLAYGRQLQSGIGYAVQNPGAVVDAAGHGLSDWWDRPLSSKLEGAGTFGIEVLASGGTALLTRAGTTTRTFGAVVDVAEEAAALRRIAANASVDNGSAVRMARIDELATANYNRLLANDLNNVDHVYRAIPEDLLDIYRTQGNISGRGGSPTHFSIEAGGDPFAHKVGAQLIDEPQVLLRIPTSELVDPFVPRPFGYSRTPPAFGREYFVNSYPRYGAGGFRQFTATTTWFSDSWIVSPWGGP